MADPNSFFDAALANAALKRGYTRRKTSPYPSSNKPGRTDAQIIATDTGI
jgi:hypothetical protein